jgi:hypothetical protein
MPTYVNPTGLWPEPTAVNTLKNSNNWHPSAASTGNDTHTSFTEHTHIQPFLLLAIYSQKEKLKN